MDNRTEKTKRKRFLAFVFDFIFIIFLSFTINGILGLFFSIDSEWFQKFMTYFITTITLVYLFFGELILNNTLGKYLFGIEIVDKDNFLRPSILSFIKRGLLKIIWPVEGLVLLFSRPKKRIGDLWAKTIVINKNSNHFKPIIRLLIGIVSMIFIYFGFSISMGFAVKNTEFYSIGKSYLNNIKGLDITGLPKEVNQNGNLVNFVVPIRLENQDKYVIVCLEKSDNKWNIYYSEFLEKHTGRTFNFNFSSCIKKEYFDSGKLSFEGSVVENKKEGTCKWFHENGQLKELTIWHNNKPQGEIQIYYSNGQMHAHGFMKNGLKHGKATLWHENGQIKESLIYENDLISGEFESYYSNGQLNEKGRYEKNKRVGLWEKYDEKGKKEL